MKKDEPYALLENAVPTGIFKDKVRRWARRMEVEPKEIHIRPMRRKWASCSTAGRVTFDTDLLRQPTGFRSEVIVHELLHLRLPNHGRLFRSLVRDYLASVGTSSARLNRSAKGPRLDNRFVSTS